MKSPALRAGLIGAAIMLFLNLISLISVLGCIALPLELVAYVAIGALAAFWMMPRREPGRGAGQGALAGLLAAVVSGIVPRRAHAALVEDVRRDASPDQPVAAPIARCAPAGGDRPERAARRRHPGGLDIALLSAAGPPARRGTGTRWVA